MKGKTYGRMQEGKLGSSTDGFSSWRGKGSSNVDASLPLYYYSGRLNFEP